MVTRAPALLLAMNGRGPEIRGCPGGSRKIRISRGELPNDFAFLPREERDGGRAVGRRSQGYSRPINGVSRLENFFQVPPKILFSVEFLSLSLSYFS